MSTLLFIEHVTAHTVVCVVDIALFCACFLLLSTDKDLRLDSTAFVFPKICPVFCTIHLCLKKHKVKVKPERYTHICKHIKQSIKTCRTDGEGIKWTYTPADRSKHQCQKRNRHLLRNRGGREGGRHSYQLDTHTVNWRGHEIISSSDTFDHQLQDHFI